MRRAGQEEAVASVLGRPHPDVPQDDDVILLVGLAAGLRPVMAPVSANSGTIDPAAVPDATWPSLCGVLTTNLYGLPDRVAELRARCDRLGIPLIEDAATPPRPRSTAGHLQLGAAAFGLLKQTPPQPSAQPAGWRPGYQSSARGLRPSGRR